MRSAARQPAGRSRPPRDPRLPAAGLRPQRPPLSRDLLAARVHRDGAGGAPPPLPELTARVIQEGAPPAILVMAGGWTAYGGSQYINSSATGRYEDAVKELVGSV